MIASIQPLFDRILLQHIKIPNLSKGGIMLPVDAQPHSSLVQAKVVATGGKPDGFKVKPGDKVLVPQYTGYKFTDEVGEESLTYSIVREEDIVGLLKN